MINKLYDIINNPFVDVCLVIFFVFFAVSLIIRLICANKKPSFGLYDSDNLSLISFAISAAIDKYQCEFLPEELEKIEHYNKLFDLYLYVCRLRGENND